MNTNFHQLLQKQINKHLTIDSAENPSFKDFIQSVNDSYLAFESEKEQMQHTFKEIIKEYHEINDQLKNEIEFKQLAANNLYKSINKDDLEYEIKYEHKDDLLFVSEFINAQISRRKEAELAFEQKMKELADCKFALDQSAIIAITDERGTIKSVNDKFCEISQYCREELIGNTHQLVNSEFHSKSFYREMQHTISSGNIWRGIVKDQNKNGGYYWLDTTIVPFLDANNKPFQYLAVRFDVTEIEDSKIELKKTKELAVQREEYTRLIMDSSLNSIVSTDKDKKITFWNQQAEIVFGWKEEEVLGKMMVDLLIPLRYRDMWDNVINDYLKNGETSYFNKRLELILINKAGNEFYVETSITPIIMGEEIYFCAFIQDISKRRQAENKLSQTAELLKAFLFNLQSGICVIDENNKILFINQHLCDMQGIKVTPEALAGRDSKMLLHESKLVAKDQESYAKRVHEIIDSKQIVLGEIFETTDNRFIEIDHVPIFLDKDKRARLWKSTDVTQRIRNQKLLEQSEQRNSLIMSSSINAIVNVDSEGKITFWNRRAELVFGYKTEEIIGMQLSETILPNHNKNIYDAKIGNVIRKDLKADLNTHIELIGAKKTGEEIVLDCSIFPINQNGKSFFCLFIQDISEKKEAEKIRKIQEEKYRNIIAHMNLGLLEVDNMEIIQYANSSFASMSGYELHELMGKRISDVFIYENSISIIKFKNEIRNKGISDIYELPFTNKKAEQKWWAISGAPNYNDKGKMIGTIGIFLDITSHKQLEVDLEKEKTNALESSKAKEIFLANMSHEIRTPLNAIIGFLRELGKQELSEIQKKYINNSSIASKHLLAIVNNILDISKIEAGEMPLESEDFIFGKIISNVTAVLQPMIDQKGLDLRNTISKDIENVLKGDALRLQQILFNLMGNAIKFTSKGGISIKCEVIENDALFQKLQISISDTGIGMDSNFISNIFNKFSQEDKSITRKFGGTGLGLSITNELVKLMGGTIEIESKKHVGTTIIMFLKFEKGSNQQLDHNDIDKPTTRIDNISILLVEDNYLNRMVVQNSLQYYNCKVTEAVNGVEAIEILKNNKFDIILMDVQMPEMGGIEATEIIRNKLNLLTPIVALTADAFKTEIDKCKKAGMNDYVWKPFDEDILIETIAKYTANKQVSGPKSGFSEPSSMIKFYNLASLDKLSRGDREFKLKMLTIFIEQTTDVIEKITAAIEMDDFMEVSRLIHKIKPSVESLGITCIIAEIRHLEKIAKKTTDKEQISSLFSKIEDVLEKTIIQLREDEINV